MKMRKLFHAAAMLVGLSACVPLNNYTGQRDEAVSVQSPSGNVLYSCQKSATIPGLITGRYQYAGSGLNFSYSWANWDDDKSALQPDAKGHDFFVIYAEGLTAPPEIFVDLKTQSPKSFIAPTLLPSQGNVGNILRALTGKYAGSVGIATRSLDYCLKGFEALNNPQNQTTRLTDGSLASRGIAGPIPTIPVEWISRLRGGGANLSSTLIHVNRLLADEHGDR